jgi:phosphatidylinositol 4-kinase B
MISPPSSRQFDLTSPNREKISHDIWKNEVTQANSSEAEDGDLGLRGLNEEFHLELRKDDVSSPSPLSPTLFPRSMTPRIDSPRLPSRSSTPAPPQDTEMDNITAHIRSAATMLAQLTSKSLPKADAQAIRTRILAEMSVLEERRLEMALATDDSDTSIERTMVDKEDPSAAVFAEDWAAKRERIRRTSVWGSLPGWELCSVIVKSDAEMEFIGSQLISGLKRIWEMDRVDIWLRTYVPPNT